MKSGSWKDRIYLWLNRIGFVGFLLREGLLYAIRYTWTAKLIILLGVLLGIGTALSPIFRTNPPDRKSQIVVTVPSGATFKQFTDSLEAHHLIRHKQIFLLLGKLSGKDTRLQAGRFEIPKGMSEWQLLKFLENPPRARIKVTLPEGILSSRMAGILAKRLGIDSSRFCQLVYDSAFASSLVPGVPNLEGYLQPETYFFEWKTPEEEIIKYLVKQTLQIFEPDSIQQQLKKLGMTPREILTLASIIEGEVMVDSERVYISSVYHNRLRKGWRLQADPTIQFAIPGPPRRLLKKDLEIDSPYNTYKYRGLPPGPINNPGKESILAALFPKKTKYLYMVAIGDGRHKFSRTLKEHNYWHARFNEIRRKIRREKRRNSTRKR